ncbi:murein transglycosylase [Actinoplanes sp. NPDC051470]|uniref:lytic transglycosylase domain-containing protein n=1 Tax=Actinoplanes sp. NPDC051470 TaxID=3157224 RepID=UPI00342F28D8
MSEKESAESTSKVESADASSSSSEPPAPAKAEEEASEAPAPAKPAAAAAPAAAAVPSKPAEAKAAEAPAPVGGAGTVAPAKVEADGEKTDAGKPDAAKDGDSKDGGSADKKDSGGPEKKDGGDGKKDVADIDLDKPVVVTTGTASGKRVTRVLRRANPIKAARTATRSTSAWAKKPSGRLLIPAVAAALLIGAAGAAGAYLVPKALEAGAAPSRSPGFPLDQAAPGPLGASNGALPPIDPNVGGFSADPVLPPVTGGGRPADSLQGWAQGVGTRVGIPVVAVQAYGYAELIAAKMTPNCHLSWTTLAAIAKVESGHGSANGSVLNADGTVVPPIYGLPLDGKGGRQSIPDTDKGVLDADTSFDRAIGPLQFIPATWTLMTARKEVDADNSGAADPNDIDDASMAAAFYLCQSGRDLSKADAWWDAILTYNAVRPYAQKVFDAANEYGQRSRV